MRSELTYREGTTSDISRLIELGLASYGRYSEVLSLDNWKQMSDSLSKAEMYEQLILNAKSFVCCDANKIVGMGFLVPSGNPTDIFLPHWSYIRMVGVHPEYGSRGIAKEITRLCIDSAKRTNEKIICLHTSEIMPVARRIYEGFGFTVLKEIPSRYGVRYWIYKLDLNTETKCSICGSYFHCGNKDNEPCWCCSLPNVMPLADSTCLCPGCLKKKIEEYKHENK